MRLKAYAKKICTKILAINKIIPKKKNRIVFYSNLGFRDNVRSVFDYLIEHQYNKRYEIICSIDEYKDYKNMHVHNVKIVNPIKGIYYFLTSKFVFYSFGQYPIKPAKTQVVVNLWHGMPFKNFGNLSEETRTEDFNFFTYTIATSEHFASVMQKCFGCSKEQVLNVGQPRCDVFLKNTKIEKENLILWMPTYRVSSRLKSVEKVTYDYEVVSVIKTKQQWTELDELLGVNNFKLIIKLHPMQDAPSKSYDFENISIMKSNKKNRDIKTMQELFLYSSALITDYSSAFFDYLLLNRQIGFVVDDYREFCDGRGFTVENPLEWMPGTKIQSFDELKEYCLNVIKGQDLYEKERQKVNSFLNKYQKSNSTEELLKKVGITGDNYGS